MTIKTTLLILGHHFYSRNRMDNTNFALGNDRRVNVCEWEGEKRVDMREWVNEKPTKKGISLTLNRWKNFVHVVENIDQALQKGTAYQYHLGGNVYCTVKEGNPCVDLRQHWKPADQVVPCKKGLCLRPSEYRILKEAIPHIASAIPELSALVPCQYRSDHSNQIGFLTCPECNPNDYTNW